MSHVEDLWTKPGPTGRRVRSERHGRGKRWLAVWSEPDGTRRKKAFEQKGSAESFLAKQSVDQALGLRRLDLTLREYAVEWLAVVRLGHPSTIRIVERSWRLYLVPALGGKRISVITRADVQAAVLEWSKTLAPGTVELIVSHLVAGLRAAKMDHLIEDLPTQGLRMPLREKSPLVILTVDQVHSISEAMTEQLRALVLLGAATGMRISEMVGLTVDRLTLGVGSGSIRVDRQLRTTAPTWGPPKSRRGHRVLGLDADTVGMMRRHIANHPPSRDGLVFAGTKGGGLASSTLGTQWHLATRGIPVRPRSGWHDLRHFHASMLIHAGLSVAAVAARLGDTEREVLKTYLHLWPTDEDRLVEAAAGMWVRPSGRSLTVVGE